LPGQEKGQWSGLVGWLGKQDGGRLFGLLSGENPALADPEEDASFKVTAAAEMLALVCEELRLAPPPSDLVEECRDLCLRGWDEGIDKLEPKPGDKEERRAVIAATFERLLKVCRYWESL